MALSSVMAPVGSSSQAVSWKRNRGLEVEERGGEAVEGGEEGEEGGGREGGWGRGTQAQCTVLRAAAKAWTVPSGSE